MSLKSMIISLSAIFVSSAAFADTFYCELNITTKAYSKHVGYASAGERSAAVTRRPFECRGKLQSNGVAYVVLLSTETSEFVTSKEGKVDMYGLDIHGDGQDHAECSCGLM